MSDANPPTPAPQPATRSAVRPSSAGQFLLQSKGVSASLAAPKKGRTSGKAGQRAGSTEEQYQVSGDEGKQEDQAQEEDEDQEDSVEPACRNVPFTSSEVRQSLLNDRRQWQQRVQLQRHVAALGHPFHTSSTRARCTTLLALGDRTRL